MVEYGVCHNMSWTGTLMYVRVEYVTRDNMSNISQWWGDFYLEIRTADQSYKED